MLVNYGNVHLLMVKPHELVAHVFVLIVMHSIHLWHIESDVVAF